MSEKCECEFIIASRAVRGKPVLCGKPGVRRQVSRQLAVSAVLCDHHAQTMAKLDFEIDPLDRTKLGSIEAEQHKKPAMSFPLFSRLKEH